MESKIKLKLLEEIINTPGTSGYEKPVRDLILKELEGLTDTVEVDNLGNIIAVKRGNSIGERKSIMLAAHLDEIGFMVNYIDDNGFLKMIPLGGFDPKTLTAMRVTVHGKKDLVGVMGGKPIHLMTAEERGKKVSLNDYYIDLGLPKEEIEKWVSAGDVVTRKQEFLEIGEMINGKSLDNRLSVYVLLETMRVLQNKEVPYDIFAVFTVQEEVGLRGANVAAHSINPDFGIALDTTIGNKTPGTPPHEVITELGKGTAVKVYDSHTICDYRMVKFLKEVAESEEIPFQSEILPVGGTDTAAIQRMGKHGAIAGALSIPVRYLHQTIEMAHKADVIATINLLVAALGKFDQFDWSH